MRPEFFSGQDVDNYLETYRSAVNLANNGDYEIAKVAFMDALEGLESLLGPTHNVPLGVLARFAKAAINSGDYAEAIQRLRKSYTDHQEVLGDKNKKTWQIYAQLGFVYRAQKKIWPSIKTIP
jgi:tetratricopeptide (TPR) repeat protein